MTFNLSLKVRLLAAVLIGAATTLAFAPYHLAFIAPISIALLFLLLHNLKTKPSAWVGFSWGFGQFATGISWVHVSIDNFGGLPKFASVLMMFLLVSYLAIYPTLFAAAWAKLTPKFNRLRFFIAAPALWLISDWLRGWVMTGFPWLWLGYSQTDNPLRGYGPLLGVEGITLALIFIGSAIAYFILLLNKEFQQYKAQKDRLQSTTKIAALNLFFTFVSESLTNRRLQQGLTLSITIILTVALTASGLNKTQWVQKVPEKKTSFALIQGDIDQAKKWLPEQRWPTLIKYNDLTRENWNADIIIWPEAAIPATEQELPAFLSQLDSAAKNNDSALITGVLDQKPYTRDQNNQLQMGKIYNSILTLGNNGDGDYNYSTAHRYSKHHLLPFGEFVPFEEFLRPIAPFFNLPMSSFSRGSLVQKNITAHGLHLAPALCYEIAFGDQVRRNVDNNTDLLLTLSNDSWFGHSIGPLQHMQMARMRSIELGRPLIRSTNNGVTAIVDEKGDITASLPQFETGVLRADVTPTTGLTPYNRWGSWPLIIYVIISLSIAIIWRFKANSKDKE
ncbi:apolipoprotein N-acyltransferase [Vibrio sp. SS-MA-C1-2]|uniref:apolipoprotein N-acyltransferase n=1 Tax=Vibrio sp. SS-MA-C1-2 TaxID=2908646 RepID=UPI001F3DDA1C|nr:apolipoprotein N-acyltransferase [Vibrio sp. SS-MA-C1-2]UJF18814.1 apolipoprotein N-acyltransferase [Vibrio sp. SS-MA-C1-2]